MMTFSSIVGRRRKGATTKFADFIRNAKADEKKRVYSAVLAEATERQNQVMSGSSAQHA